MSTDNFCTVQKIAAEDAERFAALCKENPYRFLTPRMNLETYGWNSDEVYGWSAENSSGGMEGILLRYNNICILADISGKCAAGFAPYIDSQTGLAGIRGSLEALRTLPQFLKRYKSAGLEISPFLCLNRPPCCTPEQMQKTRLAGPEDLDALADLYSQAETMYRSRRNIAARLQECPIYLVQQEHGGKTVLSAALLNLEGNDAALIGGVYTRPEARGRGLASACTAALAAHMQQQGKMPCLFYENPAAGRIYRKLGFVECDFWAVLYLRTA